jgi:hypothetical protein
MDSGLTHILLDEMVADFYAAAASDQGANLAVAVPPSASAEGGSAVVQKETPKPVGIAQAVPKASARTATVAPAVTFASSKEIPKSPADWPEPWAGWFAKTVPASVLWTYHELGADVTDIGRSQERSGFFKSLIGELGLPKGSSVFWPSAMPSASDSSLRADAPLFASGLRFLMPRVVVVFGDAALEDMGLAGKANQFGQVMVEGKLLVLLPGIEELLRGEAQRSSSVSLLRALFSTVNFGK